jgi:hypothetical protein
VLDTKCDCGDVHEFRSEVRAELEMIILTMGPTIEIALGQHCWEVPRVYIAAHGIRGFQLPRLARAYGWQQIR